MGACSLVGCGWGFPCSVRSERLREGTTASCHALPSMSLSAGDATSNSIRGENSTIEKGLTVQDSPSGGAGTLEGGAALPLPFLFYNYNEYAISTYVALSEITPSPAEPPTPRLQTLPLIVTHFPNLYIPHGVCPPTPTRIVRIPRVYPFTCETFPQFLMDLPGQEKGALGLTETSAERGCFCPQGIHLNQVFGITSVSPLSTHLTLELFREVVGQVNRHLQEAHNPFSFRNMLDTVMDLFSLGLSTVVLRPHAKTVLTALDALVERLNVQLRVHSVELISPSRSGYLSVRSLFHRVFFFPSHSQTNPSSSLISLCPNRPLTSRAVTPQRRLPKTLPVSPRSSPTHKGNRPLLHTAATDPPPNENPPPPSGSHDGGGEIELRGPFVLEHDNACGSRDGGAPTAPESSLLQPPHAASRGGYR